MPLHHDFAPVTGLGEPRDAPPPLIGAERRLATRAAAAFAGGAFADGRGSHRFRDNAVTLTFGSGGGAVVRAVGRWVRTTFALPCGALGDAPGTLAGVLGEALARLGETGAVTPFEGAVATPTAACVLRGVMLPTFDGGEAVLSWKQVLDDDATARLRVELMRELRPAPPPGAVVDAFG